MQTAVTLLLCCCAALLAPAAGQQPPKRLVCYFTNWARYRHPLARFEPQNVNPHLCTHLHYAVVNTNDEQKLGPSDSFSDIVKKGWANIVALKKQNPALKVLVMIGSSNSPQQMSFEEIAADEGKTRRFVSEAVKFLRKHDFDGVDIDWKVRGKKEDHARLLEALALGFRKEADMTGQERLLLSTTLPGNSTKIVEDFDPARASRAVDYINGLMYTFLDRSLNVTGHHAPLYATDLDSVDFGDYVVQLYSQMGGDMAKLNYAVPTFGVSFTLEDPKKRNLGSPVVGPGQRGKLSRMSELTFFEICEHVSMDGWEAFRPFPDVVGPFAVKDDQFVAYDDEYMMRRKGAYIREKGLGGAAVWAIAMDDFRGFCTGRPFPLIEALKEGLNADGVTATTPSPPTTPSYDRTAEFTCPSDGSFSKSDDCGAFYLCSDGVAVATNCSAGLRFDASSGSCSADADCEEQPLPTVSTFAATMPPLTDARTIVPPGPLVRSMMTAPPMMTSETTLTTQVTSAPIKVSPMSSTSPPPVIENTQDVASTREMIVDKDISTDGDLLQLMRLVERLGGFEKVERLLRLSEEGSINAGSPQPEVTQTVSGAGKGRVRVHVTVDVIPY